MSMAFAHCEICSIKIPRRRYGSSRGSSSRSRGSIDHRREREAEREAAPSGSSCRNQVAAPGARRVATQCQRIPYAPLASCSSWRRLCSFCLQLCSHASYCIPLLLPSCYSSSLLATLLLPAALSLPACFYHSLTASPCLSPHSLSPYLSLLASGSSYFSLPRLFSLLLSTGLPLSPYASQAHPLLSTPA